MPEQAILPGQTVYLDIRGADNRIALIFEIDPRGAGQRRQSTAGHNRRQSYDLAALIHHDCLRYRPRYL